jgi:non-heme chloroperoxidase
MTIPPDLAGIRSGRVTTGDGVDLHDLEAGAGAGADMLLVPGWSQTAAQWARQIEEFAPTHHVIAVDLRGHGDSDTPAHGYRIARLAADLHDLVTALDLDDITWLAHSMGCSLTWSYWDLYGGERIGRLVLVDEPAVLVADPAWPPGESEQLSAVLDSVMLSQLNAGLGGADGADGAAVTENLIGGMFTPAASAAEVAWTIERNLMLPRKLAGTLLLDHAYGDWRDVLPRIDVPTLVIGGAVSMFPPTGMEWVAAQIPEAQVRIFSAEERGSHFMFWENPELFASTVREFLADV